MSGFLRIAFTVTLMIPSLSWCSDDLWNRALNLASENSKWVPGLMTTETQIKDKKGNVKNSSEITIELGTDEKGEITQNLVRVLEDGQDKTEEARQRMKEEESKNPEEKKDDDSDESFSMELESASIFHAKVQDHLSFSPNGENRLIRGRPCTGYSFTQTFGQERQRVGKTWLDSETGAPMQIEYTDDPLPKHVKEMKTSIHYGVSEEGRWFPVEMTVEGVGGMLFIKRYFTSTTRFERHWEYEKAD